MTEHEPSDYDVVYDQPDADEVVVIRMTRRQWWHLDDWRAEHPDRYPKRAAERAAAWRAIDEACTGTWRSPGSRPADFGPRPTRR